MNQYCTNYELIDNMVISVLYSYHCVHIVKKIEKINYLKSQ